MKKCISSLFLLFLFSSLALSDIKIEKSNRIKNVGQGYCAWAALETLGRHHDIKPLIGLVDDRMDDYDFTKEEKNSEGKLETFYYKWVDYGNHKEACTINSGGLTAIAEKLKSLGVKFKTYDGWNKDLIYYAMRNKLGCVIACKAEAFGMEPPGCHAVILTKFEANDVRFIDSNDVEHVYYTNMAWFDKYWVGYIIIVEK